MNSKNNLKSFSENYKKLNAAQKEAVDCLDGPVLVLAGPGTGKTQLLALRAANILLKTDVQPENILCLTFTEVGARNMRERIAGFIGKEAYDVNISTYHGFGNEIMRRHREYFSDYDDTEPVDKIGQFEIMEEIYERLPTTNALWRKETYLKDALAAINEVKNNNLTPANLREIAKTNQQALDVFNPIITKHLKDFMKINKQAINYFHNLFIELQSSAPKAKLPLKISSLADLAVTSLAEALLEVEASGKTKALTAWKNNWLLKNFQDEWVLAGKREVLKLLGLADIYELYQNQLQKRRLHDYSDMILQAISVIERSDELRFNLQEKFQYIMLDEFQDTNLSQLKLIELLTNNPSQEGRPNVMAVGDDDQAIYSFQGADLTNMIRFHGLYKNVKTVTLTENWRSHETILRLAEAVSGQINERINERLGLGAKKLSAENPKIPQATVERLNFPTDSSELSWVANQIADLIKQGTPPNKIAVLAPRHKYLEPLVDYLKAKNVPIRYEKREDVFADPRIQNLLDMAKLTLALSQQDEAAANALWPKVLSADHWQIPASAIWHISWQAHQNYKEDENSSWLALLLADKQLNAIGLFFAKLALIASQETLETMLDYLIGAAELKLDEEDLKSYRCPYKSFYFSEKTLGDETYLALLANLIVIRQNLRERQNSSEGPLKLIDLINFERSYQNAGEKLLNTNPYHSSAQAVELLTAYGAKGLEFECVFALGVLDEVWGMKARGANSNITWPANLRLLKRAGQDKDERLRLFYVAITRAKHTLYLTSHSQDYAGKLKTWLEFLEETENQTELVSPHLPEQKVVQKEDANRQTTADLKPFWHEKHLSHLSLSQLKEMVLPKVENYQLSPTDLNHFTDLVHAGPASFFINKILKFPQGPSADSQYGNAIHETLEKALNILKKDGEIPDTDQIIDIFIKKIKSKKLSEVDFTRQAERGQKDLSFFMPQWWPNFEPSSQAEVNFSQEGCFLDDAHLTGNIDQIIFDHPNKLLQVIDFKTGKPHNQWTREVKIHKYRQQLLFYKLLAEQSHSYKNYQVTNGRLVFVSPNEYEQIDELTIDFQKTNIKDELERTEQLIKAVYQRIKNLDFPSVDQFSKDYKGVLLFEDWLIQSRG